VRWAAARALQGATDRDALQALITLAGDDDGETRWAAAGALQGATDPAALHTLITLLRDEEWVVYMGANRSLQDAPAGSGVAPLLSAAAQRGDLSPYAQNLIFDRLLPDDVPFADWPEG
jgi:HEAT repeat protein